MYGLMGRGSETPQLSQCQGARTVYRFDASRLDLAREYKARPFGEHLLNLMRSRETPFVPPV